MHKYWQHPKARRARRWNHIHIGCAARKDIKLQVIIQPFSDRIGHTTSREYSYSHCLSHCSLNLSLLHKCNCIAHNWKMQSSWEWSMGIVTWLLKLCLLLRKIPQGLACIFSSVRGWRLLDRVSHHTSASHFASYWSSTKLNFLWKLSICRKAQRWSRGSNRSRLACVQMAMGLTLRERLWKS